MGKNDFKIKIDKEDLKVRKKWPTDFDPFTKVDKAKTTYNRKDNKRAIEDALAEAEDENADLDFNF